MSALDLLNDLFKKLEGIEKKISKINKNNRDLAKRVKKLECGK